MAENQPSQASIFPFAGMAFCSTFNIFALMFFLGIGDSPFLGFIFLGCYFAPFLILPVFIHFLYICASKKIIIIANLSEVVIFLCVSSCCIGIWGRGMFPILLVLFLLGLKNAVCSVAVKVMIQNVFPRPYFSKIIGSMLSISFAAVIVGLITGIYFDIEKSLYLGLCVFTAVALVGVLCAIAVPHEKHVGSRLVSNEKSGSSITPIIVLTEAYITGLWLLFQAFALTVFSYTEVNTLTNASFLLIAQVLGMVTGCLVAIRLSRGHVELGLVPLGLAGMVVCPIFIFFTGTFYTILLFSALFCASVGLALTPVKAYLMRFVKITGRSSFFATQNMVTVITISLVFSLLFMFGDRGVKLDEFCFWGAFSVAFLFALIVFSEHMTCPLENLFFRI